MSYEAWRISYQSNEQAARAAYNMMSDYEKLYLEEVHLRIKAEKEIKELEEEVEIYRKQKFKLIGNLNKSYEEIDRLQKNVAHSNQNDTFE